MQRQGGSLLIMTGSAGLYGGGVNTSQHALYFPHHSLPSACISNQVQAPLMSINSSKLPTVKYAITPYEGQDSPGGQCQLLSMYQYVILSLTNMTRMRHIVYVYMNEDRGKDTPCHHCVKDKLRI